MINDYQYFVVSNINKGLITHVKQYAFSERYDNFKDIHLHYLVFHRKKKM